MQTILKWKDLMAMGVISLNWPAMPQQEDKVEDKIQAADNDDKEIQLGKLKIHILNKYSTVFSDTINKKLIAGLPMKIHLRDDIEITPQKCYVARAKPVHQQVAATKLKQELEAAGIIQKVDKPTAWTSPGFFVHKPNKGVRLVTEYAGARGLNSQILRPTHPFPAAPDIVQAIPPSARYFATADCFHGYFQLALDEESKEPHNVHAAVGKVAIPARTNGAISNIRQLLQEKQLCHRRQQERKEDCGQHSLPGIHHAGTHDKA
jgi:hypothetical protein